jgi:hypothetical protein
MTTATVRIWKRTYKPAGWAELRTREVPVTRLTPKRVHVSYGTLQIFDRATGEEILRQDVRIHQSYRSELIALDGVPIKPDTATKGQS